MSSPLITNKHICHLVSVLWWGVSSSSTQCYNDGQEGPDDHGEDDLIDSEQVLSSAVQCHYSADLTSCSLMQSTLDTSHMSPYQLDSLSTMILLNLILYPGHLMMTGLCKSYFKSLIVKVEAFLKECHIKQIRFCSCIISMILCYILKTKTAAGTSEHWTAVNMYHTHCKTAIICLTWSEDNPDIWDCKNVKDEAMNVESIWR